GHASGLEAFHRLATWTAGALNLEWRNFRRRDVLARTPGELITSGLAHLEEWTQLLARLAPPNTVFRVDLDALIDRLSSSGGQRTAHGAHGPRRAACVGGGEEEAAGGHDAVSVGSSHPGPSGRPDRGAGDAARAPASRGADAAAGGGACPASDGPRGAFSRGKRAPLGTGHHGALAAPARVARATGDRGSADHLPPAR